MTSDLVHRMRTCSATLIRCADANTLYKDAADLLAEASNLLDEPDDLGEPMEILAPVEPQLTAGAMWGGSDLPTKPMDFGALPRPCPSCGSIDVRKVSIANRRLKLTCPRCAHQWEYAREPV